MSEEILFRHAEKRRLFEEWMKDDHVLLHLDTRVEGVEVPRIHGGKFNLTLKLSYKFQGETKFDETGIETWLKFDGTYQRCFMPWAAIWGMTSDKSQLRVWQEDLPREMALDVAGKKLDQSASKLAALDLESIPPLPNAEGEPKESGKKGKTVPFLRRIK